MTIIPIPKSLIFNIIFLLTAFQSYSQNLLNIDNPVLPGVADAGVIKFNGDYYIGGVFTNGSFYISSDLVQWSDSVHVFSMDNEWTDGPSADDSQIHANDISYINGVFHQYWSVNYWGKDKHVVHIGHATSPNILGPYKEPVKDTWLANRIDPHLFMDDDRKLYLYMVKFTDGNTIWMRPMKDPWTFSGEPRYVFASLPNTWETLDNRVEEGSWVIKYRDRYYLMYNTNHTSTRWGNYALGVAEASSPLDFNHGNKYSYPIVKSNQIDMEDRFVDLLKYSAIAPGTFFFTEDKPGNKWKEINFDASDWEKGKAGFGSSVVKNSTTRKVKSNWKSSQIWVRKSFNFDKKNTGNLMLRIHHDGDTKVFLNGEPIYMKHGNAYLTWNFNKKANALLVDGENVLAIQSAKSERSNFLDISLFDMKDQRGDDILYSPGQPNILRGPNGFEWWLIYMANKNSTRRGQYINRVHFFDKKLTVDGVTGINTPGYHPSPARPTFSDLFNDVDNKQWQSKWKIKGGNWDLKNKALVQTGKDPAQALIKSKPATHYLFEAGLKMNDSGFAKAGIYAWWKDAGNWLQIGIDRENKKWEYVKMNEGVSERYAYSLPADFNYNVYHTLSVYKNAGKFLIKIDNLPAPENPVIKLSTGKGIAGLYSEGTNTAFDGVTYTIGWDEFDATINGWGSSYQGPDQKGLWSISEKGIIQKETTGENFTFKGDMLDEYEVSIQVTTEGNQGSAGIYPVYTDANNYLKAVFDFKDQKFIVSGKKNGEAVEERTITLEGSKSHYADMKYTDFIEKRFTFDTPTYINAIKLNKTPHNQPDTLIEDIHQKVNIFYQQEGKWHPIKAFRKAPSMHPGFNKITFDPVRAEALKFINKKAEDHNFYIYKIWVNEVFKQSYHLRVAKLKDIIIFFVDGKEVLRMKNDFSASQVGLLTDNTKARFNGITLFHLDTSTAP